MSRCHCIRREPKDGELFHCSLAREGEPVITWLRLHTITPTNHINGMYDHTGRWHVHRNSGGQPYYIMEDDHGHPVQFKHY